MTLCSLILVGMISSELYQHLREVFQNEFDDSEIKNVFPVYGGSINQTYGIETIQSKYFIKINDNRRYPGMFEAEKKGLELLKDKSTIRIPTPICIGKFEEQAYLLMEYVSTGSPQADFWENFGHGLAELHRNTNTHFGLDYSNYIGSLVQENELMTNWADFFIEKRLMFQERMAKDSGLLDDTISRMLDRLYQKLPGLFPEEPACLLHGDLWSGNFIVDEYGLPLIMDPAVYYGHREMDIAMSLLFGGFQKQFYQAYHESFPLEKGWEERVEIANLYPLLVHVNLFGSSYVQRVNSVLKKVV